MDKDATKPAKGRTMRLRIARNIAIMQTFLFVLVWIFLGERSKRGIYGALDESLEALAQSTAQSLISQLPAGFPAGGPVEFAPAWPVGSNDVFFELRAYEDGAPIASSPALRGTRDLLGGHAWKFVRERAGDEGWNTRVGQDDLRCWAGKAEVPSPAAGGEEDRGKSSVKRYMFIVGFERMESDRRIDEIRIRSGAGLALCLLISVAMTWALLRRGMNPLDRMVEDVSKIGPGALHPIRTPREPELALLAERLNRALAAVSESIEREKRFSSNVAHELRTPIGGLRTELEVAARRPRETREYQTVLESCHSMVLEIEGLVETILELARLEAGRFDTSLDSVDVREAVEAACNLLKAAAPDRERRIEIAIPEGERARVEVGLFDIVINNLLGNAFRYTKPGGMIRVEFEKANGGGALRVSNEAAGIPADFRERAFDAFWRGDWARTRKIGEAGQGLGLGLSLARSAARAMGADLTVVVHAGPVVCFTLAMDRRTEPPAPKSGSAAKDA